MRDRHLRRLAGRRVVVHLADASLAGTVRDARAGMLLLADATAQPSGEPLLGGTVAVPTGRVVMIQFPDAPRLRVI